MSGTHYPATLRTERDMEMAIRYLNGETLLAIGDHYGLSRERVRQILKRSIGASGEAMHWTWLTSQEWEPTDERARRALGIGKKYTRNGTRARGRVWRERLLAEYLSLYRRLNRHPTMAELNDAGSLVWRMQNAFSGRLRWATAITRVVRLLGLPPRDRPTGSPGHVT